MGQRLSQLLYPAWLSSEWRRAMEVPPFLGEGRHWRTGGKHLYSLGLFSRWLGTEHTAEAETELRTRFKFCPSGQ